MVNHTYDNEDYLDVSPKMTEKKQRAQDDGPSYEGPTEEKTVTYNELDDYEPRWTPVFTFGGSGYTGSIGSPRDYTPWRYGEDKYIHEVYNHIKATYGKHYVGQTGDQTIDFWETLGSLETTARDNAIKYLARYGRKKGHNRADLYKAIHYIILMMYGYDKKNHLFDSAKTPPPADATPELLLESGPIDKTSPWYNAKETIS